MWANGDQSNIQWWPMYHGYPYSNPNQDASADWATRAALWAQQRQAQEEMAKQHQQYYASVPNQPHPGSNQLPPEKPPLPSGDGTHQNSSVPPLPPGESEILPPKPEEHGGDNLETVAMEDEPLDTPMLEQGVPIAVTRLDYNHGQPVPLPEVGPPPHLPGMQTFDHNHGFTPAAGTPTPAFVPAQRFDYGHQSAHYEHHKGGPPPASPWYDYNHMHETEHHQPYETDRRHSRHSSSRSEPQQAHIPPALDFSSMSEIKKKALPLWIREGLEKMEREKQKKQTQELKKSLNSSISSLSNISGYDHGNIESPVPSPEKSQSDDEPESSEEEEKVIKKEKEIKPRQSSRKRSLFKRSTSRSLSPHKSDSSDDEVNIKSDSEKQQEMLLRMRKMLTEVLLSVTDDEVHIIAKEAYNEALLAENRQLRNSGGLDMLMQGGTLGVGGYGSDSESESGGDSEEDEPEQRTTEQRLHPVYEKNADDTNSRHSRSRSPRKQQSNDSDINRSRSGSPDKLRDPGSSVSSQDESDISGSASNKKKKRSKHRRKRRSPSSSPKRRTKHKHRRSRSRSRTPQKRKSSKRDRSRSHSPSASRSSRKARKQSRSRSRSPTERGRHRKYSRSRSRSPSERRHGKASRSYSRSPRSRRKKSRSKSPRKRHGRHSRSRSASSDRYREGKRGSDRRSRSRSRSSTPRHKRH